MDDKDSKPDDNDTCNAVYESIYDAVLAFNEAGDFFPLWGTCMGFQVISIVASRNASVLELNGFDSEDLSLRLDLTRAARDAPLLTSLSPGARTDLATKNITSNLHHDGVTPTAFAASNLSAAFQVLSTNKDRKGKAFVSTIAHRTLPITATQWQVHFKAQREF